MADPIGNKILNGLNQAQQGLNLPGNLRTVPGALGVIIKTVIAAASVLFLVMLIFGGITYLTGAGNEESTAKAKRMMVDALVGIILTLSAYAIATFILNRFGFNAPASG